MAQPNKLEKINKYNIVRKVSEGASGIIYLAEYEGKEFALKALKQKDSEAILRFRKEGATLARLHHENLVKIYDTGEFEDSAYLVMEYLDGQNLEQEVLKNTKLNQEDSIEIIKSVGRALYELHKNNLLHRDIKPTNIFKTKDGLVRLIDFGLVGDVTQIRTEVGLVGTPMYCSPEQSRVLKRDVDFRSDLYSLGATFFNTLTGRAPFIGTLSEILQQNASRMAPDVRELNPEVKPSVAAIIAKLLSKDPDDRYQSVSGLLFDLDRLDEIDQLLKSQKSPQLGKQDRATITTKIKFIQRAAETKKLENSWQRVLKGSPGVVLVNGPSGSGKSRLCSEFVASIRTKSTLVLTAKCQLFNQKVPFTPIREALNYFFEEISSLEETIGTREQERMTAAAVGSGWALNKLNNNIEKSFSESKDKDEDRLSNFEEDAEVFFNQLSSFFARLNDHWDSVVFYIDDFQWLDQASSQIFHKIFEDNKGIKFLLLGTARTDQESMTYLKSSVEKLESFTIDQITVEIFNKNQLSSLVGEYLGTKSFSPNISETLNRLSRGNPFIAVEYLRSAMEQNFLRFEKGTWLLNQEALETIALSQNVYELIVKRVELSSSEAKNFLQHAAFVGSIFSETDVAEATGTDLSLCRKILTNCENLVLVEKLSSVKWKFIHDKIPESLISSMQIGEVKQAQDKLANYFFEKQEKSTEEIFLTARLFTGGNTEDNAKRAALSQAAAGDHAMKNFTFNEAYFFYKAAYKLLKMKNIEHQKKIEISPKLAICSSMYDDEALAREAIEFYIETAKSNEQMVHALSLNTLILANLSDFVGSCENFKRALTLLGRPYPKYLHWKLLQIVWTWFCTIFLEIIPVKISKNLYFRSKAIDLIDITNMFRVGLLSFENRSNLFDGALVSLKLVLVWQLTGGTKERAMSYATLGWLYGVFGLKKLALKYSNKAGHIVREIKDKSVEAYCDYRRLLGLFSCGVIKEFHGEFLLKREFLSKFLWPSEFGRINVYASVTQGLRGLHKSAFDLANRNIDAYEKKTIRVSKALHLFLLSQSHQQLTLLGLGKEAQKVKSVLMPLSNEFRFNPMGSRLILTMEVIMRRASEELGITTDEIVNCWWKRGSTGMDPLFNNYASLLTYIRLYQFSSATGEEKFNARQELNEMLRNICLKLYCPLFRSTYYFLQGSYNRILGKMKRAEFYYGKAEQLASESGNLIVLFDIQRDRARIHLQNKRFDLMNLSLASAFSLAIKHNWDLRKTLLTKEFSDYLEFLPNFTGLVSSDSAPGNSSHLGKNLGEYSKPYDASQTQMRASQTNMGGGISASQTKMEQSGGIRIAGIELEEVRFIDAILNVSNAFVVSIDPIEQSKAVLHELVKLFAAERGLLFELKEGSNELSIVAGKNSEGFELDGIKSFSNTIVNKVFIEKRPIIIAGTDEAEALGSESVVLYNLRSIMAVPLILKGKLLGVVYLDSSLTRGLFTVSDISLFSTLANHISVALELSRMKQVEVERANLKRELDIQSVIARESGKVKILVDSMQQALFSVTNDGTIVEPVSKFTSRVLGHNVVGQNFIDVLYKDLSHQGEQVAGIHAAMSTVFGEDDLQWELMEANFPNKVEFLAPIANSDEKDERIFKINPSPVWDDKKNLEKILFVVEDVTSLEVLEKQVKEHKIQSLMLEDILKSDSKDLREFFSSIDELIKSWREISATKDAFEPKKILRDMHTQKGISRLYRLRYLSEQIHNSESALLGVSGSENSLDKINESFLVEIGNIEMVLKQYSELFTKIFGNADSTSDSSSLNELAVNQLEKTIADSAKYLPLEDLKNLNHAILRLKYRSISSGLRKFDKMVIDISRQLNKKVQLEIDGEALIDITRLKTINECIVHLIRNSIDHGLEEPNERIQNGKPEMGLIRVNCSENSDKITVVVTDDGRGINAEKISEIAVSKGIISDAVAQGLSQHQKLELIYASNFSTKSDATDISGRGIGMDVVKRNVEKMGGVLDLKTEIGKGSAFTITLKQAS